MYKMKIYTFYSQTHQILYENYFKKSLRKIYNEKQLPIVAYRAPQEGKTGSFTEKEFIDAMKHKYTLLYQAAEENQNKPFVYSDCDVQFFKPFIEELIFKFNDADYDLLCQEDRKSICAGFFITKGTDKFKHFLDITRSDMQDFRLNDQVS